MNNKKVPEGPKLRKRSSNKLRSLNLRASFGRYLKIYLSIKSQIV